MKESITTTGTTIPKWDTTPITAGRIFYLEKRLADLERLVTDEILGLTEQTKSDPNAELNYTWDDYFGENQ